MGTEDTMANETADDHSELSERAAKSLKREEELRFNALLNALPTEYVGSRQLASAG